MTLPFAPLLLASACKDTLDKVNHALYKPEGNSGWDTDSLFLASNPTVLFRIYHLAGAKFAMPIAAIGRAGLRELHMTQRGWRAFDINMLYAGNKLIPLRNGQPLAPLSTQRGMWEDPLHPLDTLAGCPVLVPRASIANDVDATLALTNYKAPSGALLDPGALQTAINLVPSLVAPTLGVSGAQLSHYTRFVHQITHEGGPPSVLLEYHDPEPVVDTGVVQGVRPHHLIVILDKGVYGYRPSWSYKTTGMSHDREVLHYLDAVDTNADGVPELFFSIDYKGGYTFTVMYRQWNDTWREMWRRGMMRCDV